MKESGEWDKARASDRTRRGQGEIKTRRGQGLRVSATFNPSPLCVEKDKAGTGARREKAKGQGEGNVR